MMIEILAQTTQMIDSSWFSYIDKYGFATVIAVILLGVILADKRAMGKRLTTLEDRQNDQLAKIALTSQAVIDRNSDAIERNSDALNNMAVVIEKCKK